MTSRTRTRNRGSRAAGGSTLNWLVGTALSVVLAAGAFGAVYMGDEITGPPRDADGCLLSPTEARVLALDGTSAFTDTQRRSVADLATSELERLPPDAGLFIFQLTSASELEPRLLLSTCAPAATSEGVGGPTEGFRKKDLERKREKVRAEMANWHGTDTPTHDLGDGIDGLLRLPAFENLRAGSRIQFKLVSNFLDMPPATASSQDLVGTGAGIVVVERDREPHLQEQRLAAWQVNLARRGAAVDEKHVVRLASGEAEPRDAQGCLQFPKHRELVALDVTDPYSLSQSSTIRSLVEDKVSGLPADGVLELFEFKDHAPAGKLRPSLRFCAPESGASAGVRSAFETRVRNSLSDDLPVSQSLARSPIMENMAAMFRQAEGSKVERVTLISDMIFNSSQTMIFWENGVLPFEEALKRPAVYSSLVNLHGIPLDIYYARRDSFDWTALQSERHLEFIGDWIGSQGGIFDPLENLVILPES